MKGFIGVTAALIALLFIGGSAVGETTDGLDLPQPTPELTGSAGSVPRGIQQERDLERVLAKYRRQRESAASLAKGALIVAGLAAGASLVTYLTTERHDYWELSVAGPILVFGLPASMVSSCASERVRRLDVKIRDAESALKNIKAGFSMDPQQKAWAFCLRLSF